MISVWEIITKTERALMTYILPSNAVNGKIIDHSEIMVYDGVSPIESYLRLDDLPPLTPPPLVHAYSRLENLTEPTSCDKYLFINGVLKVNEAFRKDILGALPPLPYSEQPLALLCSTEDVDLAYTAQCQSTGYQLQLSPSVVEAIESFQDPYYCTELRVKELELAANLDNLMSLFDQLEIPIGCLHKLKALKDHHIYILIDECSLMESPSPYSRADAHEVLRSRRNDDESDQLTYWEYCESLLHNFIDILCYVPMKSVRVAFSHSKDLGIYCDRANKIIPPKRFQEKFHTKISAAFVEIQRKLNSYPDSMLTPAMRYAFDRAQKEVDRTVLLVLSSGKSMNDGADMKALIAARPLPEKAPVIFLPIGDTATHSWMRGVSQDSVNSLYEYLD